MARKQKNNEMAIYTGAIENAILNFACAMVRCERTDGKPDHIPNGWAVRNLIKYGMIGYLHSATEAEGLYRVAKIADRDRYGTPRMVNAQTDATGSAPFVVRTTVPGETEDGTMSIIRANATASPPFATIQRYAEMIAKGEFHVNVNLLASLRSQIVSIPGEQSADFDLIMENAMCGFPTKITPDLLSQMDTIDISVPLDAPQVYNLTLQLWASALKQFGGVTPESYKAERTQTAEVDATIAQSIDNVYILIDQANADCKRQNVPLRFVYAGYGAVYDRTEEISSPSQETPMEEQEERDNEII